MAVIYLQVELLTANSFFNFLQLFLAVPGAGDLNRQVDEEAVLWPVESGRV